MALLINGQKVAGIGRPGVGIETIERTSGNGSPGTNDIYTIALTDGSTSEFSVYNGADGVGATAMGYIYFTVTEDGELQYVYSGDVDPNVSIDDDGHLIFEYPDMPAIDAGKVKGENATINGVNTLNIVAGDNIKLKQDGDTLEISSTGGGGGDDCLKAVVSGDGSGRRLALPINGADSGEIWSQMAYGNGVFVAVGGITKQLMYSHDGIHWMTSSMPFLDFWDGVIFDGNRFIASSDGSPSGEIRKTCFAYSYDGISWMTLNIIDPNNFSEMFVSNGYVYMACGNGTIVALNSGSVSGGSGGRNVEYLYSTDNGNQWIWSNTLPTGVSMWMDIEFGNGAFIAAAYNRSIIGRSSDGISWEELNVPIASTGRRCLSYGNGCFVFVGARTSEQAAAAYSTNNGSTWTAVDLPASFGISPKVAFGNGMFVALDPSSSDVAAYSTDCKVWTEVRLPVSDDWADVIYGNGRFVAIGYQSDNIVYSEDGITWSNTEKNAIEKIVLGDQDVTGLLAEALLGYQNDAEPSIVSFDVTIPAASWQDNAQSIVNAAFVVNGYDYLVSPNVSSYNEYVSCVVRADDIKADGSVVFYCDKTPTQDLVANFLKMKVSEE